LDLRKEKKSKKMKKDELINTFWEVIILPLLDKAIESTQKPVKDIILELAESGTTLGYLAKVYGFEKYLKKFDYFFKIVKETAKSARPEDVDKFIGYIIEEVLPRKDPILAELFKNDQKVYEWFRQSIFELWQMFKGG